MKYFVTVNGNKYEVEVEAENSNMEVAVTKNAAQAEEIKVAPKVNVENTGEVQGELITAPMPGKIISVNVSNGQTVKKDDLLFVLEAMKMENEIVSPMDGVISTVFIQKDTVVNAGDKLTAIQ